MHSSIYQLRKICKKYPFGLDGMCCDKIFRKKACMVKSKWNFSVKCKNSYRNIQYSYLLSKGLRNLFPGLLEKIQMPNYFFPVPNLVETLMEALPLKAIYLFNQVALDFLFKNVLNITYSFLLRIILHTCDYWVDPANIYMFIWKTFSFQIFVLERCKNCKDVFFTFSQ